MKNKLLPTIILLSLTGFYLRANENIKYAINEIPAKLTNNAKAVIRCEEHEFILISETRAYEKIRLVISILNENGYPLAQFKEFYNKFIKIRNINAVVYSGNGEKLHRIKYDDIMDLSATSGISLYDDNRIKTFDPKTKDYPFTVEYTFERDYIGIFSFPIWSLFKDYNVSVEMATFFVKTLDPSSIHIEQRNFNHKAVEYIDNDYWTISWTFNDFEARIEEPFSQPILEYTPTIQVAPSVINIKGNKGECNSWEQYGLFISQLNEGRSILSEERYDEVIDLTKNATSEYEKIRLIYEHMQSRTRYVSIQAGIGGWQPFDANTVDRLGYGDCKALSNYMKSLLKGVGIDAIYTLVNSGENALSLNRDFPSNQFNHAILCVPLEKDTLWLECTNQQIPCGFLGKFTDDRDVLLITKEGGKIAHTKSYNIDENVIERNAEVKIGIDGNGMAKVSSEYTGLRYDKVFPVFGMDAIDQKKYVIAQIDIPNFSLSSFSHENIKTPIPCVKEILNIQLNNYTSQVGNRFLLPLNLMNKYKDILTSLKNRESDIIIRRSYKDIDTIIYILPDEYKIEQVPAPVSINSPYGYYEAKAKNYNNKIIYTRLLSIKKGNYPAGSYNNFLNFFEKINITDDMKCLLKNQ